MNYIAIIWRILFYCELHSNHMENIVVGLYCELHSNHMENIVLGLYCNHMNYYNYIAIIWRILL